MTQIRHNMPTTDYDANALVAAGLVAHRAGRLPEAGALYAKAMKLEPDHVDALNLAGAVAFAGGRVDDAIRLIGKAVKRGM